jgi:hypothetical protein
LRKILIPLARRNKREIFALPNDTNGIGEIKEELGQEEKSLKGEKIYFRILLLVKKLQLPLHPGSQGTGIKKE